MKLSLEDAFEIYCERFRLKDFVPIKGYLEYSYRNRFGQKESTMQDLILGVYNFVAIPAITLGTLGLVSKLIDLR
jgi:hypothetical protein